MKDLCQDLVLIGTLLATVVLFSRQNDVAKFRVCHGSCSDIAGLQSISHRKARALSSYVY